MAASSTPTDILFPSASPQAKGPLSVVFLIDTRPPSATTLTPALVAEATTVLHGTLVQLLLYFQVSVNSHFEWAYTFFDSFTRGNSMPNQRKLQRLTEESIKQCVDEYKSVLSGYVANPQSRQKHGSPLYNIQRELIKSLADFGFTNYVGMNRKKGLRHTWLQSHFAPVPIRNYLYLISPMPHSWSEMVEFESGYPSNRGDYYYNDVQVMDILNPVREAFFSKGLWDGFVDHCLSWSWIDSNPDPLVEFPKGRGTYPGMNRVVMENIMAAYGGHIIPQKLISSPLAGKDIFSFSTHFKSYRSFEINPGLGISMCNPSWRPGYEYAIAMVPDRNQGHKYISYWFGDLLAAQDNSKVICRMNLTGRRPRRLQSGDEEQSGEEDEEIGAADEFMKDLGTVDSVELVQRFSCRRITSKLSLLDITGYLYCFPVMTDKEAEVYEKDGRSRIKLEEESSSAKTLLKSLLDRSQVMELKITFRKATLESDSHHLSSDVTQETQAIVPQGTEKKGKATSPLFSLQAILYAATSGTGIVQVLRTAVDFQGTKPLRRAEESPVNLLIRATKRSATPAPVVDLLKRSISMPHLTNTNLINAQGHTFQQSSTVQGKRIVPDVDTPKLSTAALRRNILLQTGGAPQSNMAHHIAQKDNTLKQPGSNRSLSSSSVKPSPISREILSTDSRLTCKEDNRLPREFCMTMLDPAFIDLHVFVESTDTGHDTQSKQSKEGYFLQDFPKEIKAMTDPWQADDHYDFNDADSEDFSDDDDESGSAHGDQQYSVVPKSMPGWKVDVRSQFKVPESLPETIDAVCMGFRRAYLDHLYSDERSVLDYVHRLNAACKKITALAAKESIPLKDAMQQLVSFIIEFVRIWPDMLEAKYYQLSKDIGIEIRYRLTGPDRYVIQQDERSELDPWVQMVKKCVRDSDLRRYRDKLEKKDTQIQIVQNLHILMLMEKYSIQENKPFKNDPGALDSARSLMENLGIKALSEEENPPAPFKSPRSHDTVDMNSAKRFHKNIIERFYAPSLPKVCRNLARACGLDDRFMRSPRPMRRPDASLYERMTKPKKLDLVAIKAEKEKAEAEKIKQNPILKILKSSVFRNREVTLPAGVIKGVMPSSRKKKSSKADSSQSASMARGLERSESSSSLVAEDEVEVVPRFAKIRRKAPIVQTARDYAHMGDLAHFLPLKKPDLSVPTSEKSSQALVPLSPAPATPSSKNRTEVVAPRKRSVVSMDEQLKSPKKRRPSMTTGYGEGDVLKSPRGPTTSPSASHPHFSSPGTPTRRQRGSGSMGYTGLRSPSFTSSSSKSTKQGSEGGVVPETPVASQGRVLYYKYGLTTDELHGAAAEPDARQPKTPTHQLPARFPREKPGRSFSSRMADFEEKEEGGGMPPTSPSQSLWVYASQLKKKKNP
ncbi:hypothetical protein BGZ83_000161 [Gryganskiella cystojenkinii]|nr:hypothetical protein BGZ83_000161 [Gryganskiella cystojenkinii]